MECYVLFHPALILTFINTHIKMSHAKIAFVAALRFTLNTDLVM